MPELWAAKDAVNRKFKELWAAQNGTNRKLKEVWARDSGGVNRKIFSGELKWTYSEADYNYHGSVYGHPYTPDNWTHGISAGNAHNGSDFSIRYDFNNSLNLPNNWLTSVGFADDGNYSFLSVVPVTTYVVHSDGTKEETDGKTAHADVIAIEWQYGPYVAGGDGSDPTDDAYIVWRDRITTTNYGAFNLTRNMQYSDIQN